MEALSEGGSGHGAASGDRSIPPLSSSHSASHSHSHPHSYSHSYSHSPPSEPEPSNIKVYLRLRPKNKLETMKRGKDCIELHEDPKTITVDSPRLGEHRFSLDRVFDEFATQEEVYQDALDGIPSLLVGGTSATVLAYGQSGSGKTHTLLGEGKGIELVALAHGDAGGSIDGTTEDGDTGMGRDMGRDMDIGRDTGRDIGRDTGRDSHPHSHPHSRPDPRKHPRLTAGMIPRLVAHVFELLYESAPSDSAVQFSVRCSYAEVYLDRIRDLLRPAQQSPPRIEEGTVTTTTESFSFSSSQSHSHSHSHSQSHSQSQSYNTYSCRLVGATELCCVCPEDVYALLARGQALRTKAANDAGVDSGRSHAVFDLHLERTDAVTGELRTSRLRVFDLAGSQGRVSTHANASAAASAAAKSPAVDAERSLANASLASFHRLVRDTLQQQQQQQHSQSQSQQQQSQQQSPPPQNLSKIARLLRPSIGGTTHTTMICTGSPSSYSIDETIQTISFGRLVQQIINRPRSEFEGYTPRGYRERLALAEHRQDRLTRFLRLVALECKHGKKKSRDPKNPRVWEAVLQIVEAEKARNKKDGGSGSGSDHQAGYNNNSNNNNNNGSIGENFTITIGDEGEQERELRQLRARLAASEQQLTKERSARETFESKYRDATSELVSLRSQQESFATHKRRLEEEVAAETAKRRELSAEHAKLEHQLRTSRFRENESILFLRQFRTFYFRLLRNTAALGSGTTRELMEDAKHKLPEMAPDLEDLLDVDRMMVKSGIIESSEIGADTPTAEYKPSGDALSKSASEAKKAEERELAWISKEQLSDEFGTPPSGLTRGQLVACRQKLLLSPAGRLSIKKEQELEENLSSLSEKCIGLQSSLNAEKSMVQALTGRQGAVTKMKQIQETIILKTELERRTNDLMAIVWKMNELHLVNKTLNSKAASREQHSSYLSDYLSEIQTRNQRRLSQIEQEGERLRDENSHLRNQLEGITLELWQLGEQLEKAPMWRCVVPFTGECSDYGESEPEPDCRRSEVNVTEEEIDGLIEIVRCNE